MQHKLVADTFKCLAHTLHLHVQTRHGLLNTLYIQALALDLSRKVSTKTRL
jgi:hypothetical protein